MMESANKRQKKGFVSEEDVSTLLQRYSATKVLTLLREVDQSSSGTKIDWDALVKKTATGITNAREYQMVWRHIAYRQALADKVDEGAVPMDDDSDLEYELEASPDVGAEATAEAAACVKVLSASGLPSEANVQNCSTAETPLSTNIPNRQFTKPLLENHAAPSALQGSNIPVPVSVPKLPTPAAPSSRGAEASDTNGSGNSNIPPRRKRKPWLEEEDSELLAAVKKFGEGNWTTILKEGFFKGDRTASQLAQRWAILKKKQNHLTVGSNTSGSHISEAQLAANRAIDMAFKDTAMTVGNGAAGSSMNPPAINTCNGDKQPSNSQASQPQKSPSQPGGGNPKPVTPSLTPKHGGPPKNPVPKLLASADTSMVQPSNNQASQPQKCLSESGGGSSKPITPSLTPKLRGPPKNPAPKLLASADTSMVTATAVAAGARIASPSDAATVLKAFQANNAIHIKASMTSSSTPLTAHRNVSHPAMGLARHLPSPTSHATTSQPVRANHVRPTGPTGPTTSRHLSRVTMPPTLLNRSNCPLPSQPSKATTSSAGMAAERSNNPASSSGSGPPLGNRITSEENKTRPLLATSKTQNAEAKINLAPVLSSSELVTSQVLAAEKSLCVAGLGKKGDIVGNRCYDDAVKNVRSQMVVNNSICAVKMEKEPGGKDEKAVTGKPGCLLIPKDGNIRSLEVAKEVNVKLERKDQ